MLQLSNLRVHSLQTLISFPHSVQKLSITHFVLLRDICVYYISRNDLFSNYVTVWPMLVTRYRKKKNNKKTEKLTNKNVPQSHTRRAYKIQKIEFDLGNQYFNYKKKPRRSSSTNRVQRNNCWAFVFLSLADLSWLTFWPALTKRALK